MGPPRTSPYICPSSMPTRFSSQLLRSVALFETTVARAINSSRDVGVGVNFRLPCESRLASDRRRTYIAPLGDFDPLLARRSRPWPGRDDVVRARRRRKVREVRQHDHRHRRSSPAPAPHNYLLAGSKVGPDEVGVIAGQSRRGGSQLYQGLYVGVDTPTHQSIVTVGVALFVCAGRCSQPAEVHRVHLLTRALSYVSVYIEKVMLVSKLLPGEKHWNPDRRH